MERRDFLKVASLAGALPLGSAVAAAAEGGKPANEFYELRQYQMVNRGDKTRLHDFLREAAVPAMNRLGLKPIGVFDVVYGPSASPVYLLIPHSSADGIATLTGRLLDDAEFRKAGAAFLDRPIDDPVYARVETSFMRAFDAIPKLELPKPASDPEQRIFELRIYESHSLVKAKKKIQMFNEGGEIAIFRATGLQPVFFGETLAGARMPNLNYMVAFDSIAARYERWKVFGDDPRWIELKGKPEYADTVCNITDIILRPAPYSQII